MPELTSHHANIPIAEAVRIAGRLDAPNFDVLYDTGVDSLLQAARSYDPLRGVEFDGWLVLCVRRRVQGNANQATRRWERNLVLDTDFRKNDDRIVEPSHGNDLLADAVRSEELTFLQQELARLPEEQRSLLLGWASGKTMRQLAVPMGVTREAMRQKVNKLLAELRRRAEERCG